jgi:CheY-like chemotaxis protein
VDVRRLLSGLADLLRRTLHEGVDLVVEEPNETWCIWADANQMENALLSLAVNVRDQVVDGGVLIVSVTNVQLNSVCTEKKPLLLPGDYVCISVSPSPRAAALDASLWQQTDDLNSAGLAMARGFVHDAGGTLLRSDPAEPALSLRLLLPRFLPPTPAPGVDRRRAGVTRILVVEDDEAVRRACVEALSGLDYQILEAPDAMEAFRLIADHGGIDLLLTDLGLPGGVSGRALADAARNVDRGIRVVFTTGYERADSTAQLGGTLLRKPFSSAQLAEKVREALAPGKAGEPTETVQG